MSRISQLLAQIEAHEVKVVEHNAKVEAVVAKAQSLSKRAKKLTKSIEVDSRRLKQWTQAAPD